MSIKELIYYIQLGDNTLYPELWEKIQRFVMKQARIYINQLGGRYGVEQSDLINSGYIAMCKAVPGFDVFRGNGFLGWLLFYLKSEWAELCGFRSTRIDALNVCGSLDEPLSDDAEETIADITPDTQAIDPHDHAERKDEISWLKANVDAYIKMLPLDLEQAIRYAYLRSLKNAEIAQILGCDTLTVSRWKNRALNRLRSLARRTPLGQKLKEYYRGRVRIRRVGPRKFNTTHTSEAEQYVLDLEQKELSAWQSAPYSAFDDAEKVILAAYRYNVPEAQILVESYIKK